MKLMPLKILLTAAGDAFIPLTLDCKDRRAYRGWLRVRHALWYLEDREAYQDRKAFIRECRQWCRDNPGMVPVAKLSERERRSA